MRSIATPREPLPHLIRSIATPYAKTVTAVVRSITTPKLLVTTSDGALASNTPFQRVLAHMREWTKQVIHVPLPPCVCGGSPPRGRGGSPPSIYR